MVNFVVVVVLVVLATISSIQCNHPHHEPPADDSFVDFARVHFMDKKRDEFMDLLPDVKNSIAKNLNEYCKEKDCDTDVANFTADHVGFYGANEKETFFEDGRFIIIKLFAKTGRDKVLSKEKIGEFVTSYRDKIVEESKVQIAYVNNELVYPPRNNLDNWIIVIVSCVFCVILIGINLACTMKHAKIAKREFLKKAAQEKKPIVRREPNPVYLPNVTNEDVTPESKLLLVAAPAAAVSHTTAKPTPVPLPSIQTPPPLIESQPVQSSVNKINERPSELVNTSSQEPANHHRHHHHHHHHHHEKNPDRPHSHKKKKTNGNGGGGGIPSSNSSTIVGNVGSGLGSPRNITAEYQSDDDEDPESRIQVISSRRPVKAGNMNTSNSTYTMYKNATTGEVQIPIQRVDRLDYEPQTRYYQQQPANLGRGSYTNVNMQGSASGSRGNLNSGSRRNVTTLSEYSDSKVAYRLASTEHL